jgi:hypothetical protein
MSGPVPAQIGDARTLEELKEQIRLIATTEFVPGHYRGRPHAILAAIYTGREIGLQPLESLSDLYIVTDREGKPKGKPTLHASAMVKLARRAGHSITGTVDDKKATVTGRRGDNGDEMTVTYTLAQAQQAGLIRQGGGWEKNPEDLLWARAVSRLCRRLFADCIGGITHTPEDMVTETPEGRMQAALSGPVVDDGRVEIVDGDFGEPTVDPDADAIPFGDEEA